MKTVVCFGDSNTYGTPGMPNVAFWGRFDFETRWPGVMGRSLGPGWMIIEEGLPGRTTVHDDPIEGADRNGLTALPMVLGSHRPIDLLVIALGTNDLKSRFSMMPEDIAASVGVLVQTALASQAGVDGKPPTILVIAPASIEETGFLGGFFKGGAEKSRRLGVCFADMAERLGVELLDAAQLIVSDPLDGVHFKADQHAILGRAVADKVRHAIG